MKLAYYIVLVIAIGTFATSCSNRYEETVSNYVIGQGADAELEVKIKGIKEIKKVTVGDSITYINLQAELVLRSQIDATEGQISKYQDQIVGENNGNASKIIVEAYTKEIMKQKLTIDSLKAIKLVPTTLYGDRKTDDILAIIVEGNYTITNVATQNATSAITNFVLSPDGKVCYGVTDNPQMDIAK